jgi:acetyl-CoA carboxylase carboxyl transferase subunit alpha
MTSYLDFEKPIADLDGKIKELKLVLETTGSVSLRDEIAQMERKSQTMLRDVYTKLDAWQKTQVARHPQRPHFLDYVKNWMEDFTFFSGDRCFGDDHAILGGIGFFQGKSIVLMGHERGHDLQTRLKHNFGMGKPEGYRKALRLMDLAQRFRLPVVTLVDTPGAYPGIGAEERGQAEAIARSTQLCLNLGVPLISVIIGEGGSGGAVSLATANRVLMLENSVYSVISPEGCASILWRDAAKAKDAANALKISADKLLELKVIDGVIPEPLGGAHRHPEEAISQVGHAVEKALSELSPLSCDMVKQHRREKFLYMGGFE